MFHFTAKDYLFLVIVALLLLVLGGAVLKFNNPSDRSPLYEGISAQDDLDTTVSNTGNFNCDGMEFVADVPFENLSYSTRDFGDNNGVSWFAGNDPEYVIGCSYYDPSSKDLDTYISADPEERLNMFVGQDIVNLGLTLIKSQYDAEPYPHMDYQLYDHTKDIYIRTTVIPVLGTDKDFSLGLIKVGEAPSDEVFGRFVSSFKLRGK